MVLELLIYIFFTGLLDDVYNIYIALVFVYFPVATFRPTFRTWTRVVRLVSSCSLWTGSPSSRSPNARTRYWRYEPIEHLQLMYKHDVFTIQEDWIEFLKNTITHSNEHVKLYLWSLTFGLFVKFDLWFICKLWTLTFFLDKNVYFSWLTTLLKMLFQFQRLNKYNGLRAISDSIANSSYGIRQCGISDLRHFLYKSRSTAQFTSPEIEAPYLKPEEQERLFGLYLYLHHRIHMTDRPLKILYHVGQHETLLGWASVLFVDLLID